MAHALHLHPVPSHRPAPPRPQAHAARPHVRRAARTGPLRLVAPRPAVARWTWLALVVVLGIAAFVGLDQLRTVVGDAVVGPFPAATAPTGDLVARPVAPGETLWSIAQELRPGDDPRPLVDQLARLNGGSALVAGGSVLVPVDVLARR